MNSDESNRHNTWKAWVVAYLLAALLMLLLAFLLTWLQMRQPKPEPPAQEDFVTEYITEDIDDSPDEPTHTDDAEHTDQKVDADDTAQQERADEQPVPPEEPPKPDVPKEEEPQKPEEQEVIMVEEKRRQSVDQPTTNQESPESDDYFLSDVDNRADEQTIAENATKEYEDAPAVDSRIQESDNTEDEGVPEPTRDDDTPKAEEPNERDENQKDDARDNTTQGVQDAPAKEQKEQKAAPKSEREQQQETPQAQDDKADATLVEQGEKGDVKSNDQQSAVQRYGSASGLGSRMQDAAKASKEDGKGQASVTRGGADFVREHYDEVLGDRTAVYKDRAEEKRREDSLLGDHRGQWQRTRQAMENFDVAIETGSETHLNTKRDDYARFINTYHAQIHEAWWQQVGIMDRRDGKSQQSFDADAVKLEMRILADGHIDKVAIVSTSGNTFMDAEAIRINYAVKKTIRPPENIVCKDGAVYLHWEFSRGPGKCSTEGASMHCPK